jgi:hypothetical protein
MRFEPCRPGWVPTLALFVGNHGHGDNYCLRPGAWEENRTPDLRIAATRGRDGGLHTGQRLNFVSRWVAAPRDGR